MSALVGCEESGEVRRALRARGVDAWSCDVEPARDGSPFHLQMDIFEAIALRRWKLGIFFPPCTHLATSGARWLTDHWVEKKSHPDGRYWHDGSEKRRLQVGAVDFARRLYESGIEHVALENPIGVLPRLWRRWDQIIHPWQFWHLSEPGAGEVKATCLWLKNLSKLRPTTPDETGRHPACWLMPPGPNRARDRSKTYPGIADAMSYTWGAVAL